MDSEGESVGERTMSHRCVRRHFSRFYSRCGSLVHHMESPASQPVLKAAWKL